MFRYRTGLLLRPVLGNFHRAIPFPITRGEATLASSMASTSTLAKKEKKSKKVKSEKEIGTAVQKNASETQQEASASASTTTIDRKKRKKKARELKELKREKAKAKSKRKKEKKEAAKALSQAMPSYPQLGFLNTRFQYLRSVHHRIQEYEQEKAWCERKGIAQSPFLKQYDFRMRLHQTTTTTYIHNWSDILATRINPTDTKGSPFNILRTPSEISAKGSPSKFHKLYYPAISSLTAFSRLSLATTPFPDDSSNTHDMRCGDRRSPFEFLYHAVVLRQLSSAISCGLQTRTQYLKVVTGKTLQSASDATLQAEEKKTSRERKGKATYTERLKKWRNKEAKGHKIIDRRRASRLRTHNLRKVFDNLWEKIPAGIKAPSTKEVWDQLSNCARIRVIWKLKLKVRREKKARSILADEALGTKRRPSYLRQNAEQFKEPSLPFQSDTYSNPSSSTSQITSPKQNPVKRKVAERVAIMTKYKLPRDNCLPGPHWNNALGGRYRPLYPSGFFPGDSGLPEKETYGPKTTSRNLTTQRPLQRGGSQYKETIEDSHSPRIESSEPERHAVQGTFRESINTNTEQVKEFMPPRIHRQIPQQAWRKGGNEETAEGNQIRKRKKPVSNLPNWTQKMLKKRGKALLRKQQQALETPEDKNGWIG